MTDPLRDACSTEPVTPSCVAAPAAVNQPSVTPAAPVQAAGRRRPAFWFQSILLFAALGSGLLLAWLAFYFGVQSVYDRETAAPADSRLATPQFKPNEGVVEFDTDIVVTSRSFSVKGSPGPTPPAFTYKVPAGLTLKELLPTPAKFKAAVGPMLSDDVTRVPEVALAAPGTRTAGDTPREHLSKQVVKIAHLSKTRLDGFMETLAAERGDLAGLPLVMGDACRMNEERSRQFELALKAVRAAEESTGAGQQPMADVADAFWNQFLASCRKEDQAYTAENATLREQVTLARIAALMQVLAPKSLFHRKGLVQYLAGVSHVDATQTLAKLTLFSAEAEVRYAAIEALKVRRDADYTAVLLQGLSYPWPAVATRAADALVKLKPADVVPQLVDLLDMPDPRAPIVKEVNGKEAVVVRELVKLNHHHNCLLCHAPGANRHLDPDSPNNVQQEPLTAAIAIPGESLPAPSQGYRAQPHDLVVRLDVTYLRQDFSLMVHVPDAHPWPALQRFDFLVRSRVLSEGDAAVYQEKLAKQGPGAVTPYERAILSALRELTGRDTEPTAAAWRKVLASASPQ